MPDLRRALFVLLLIACVMAIPAVAIAGDGLVLATAEEEGTETPEPDIGIQPAVEASSS